jgi:putative oxidoreductase
MRSLLFLDGLHGRSDAALLVLRVLVGSFLMWGTWDNVTSPERMQEFVQFLTLLHCPMPELAAPVSVYAQFLCGALILVGLFTRWAGLVMTFNFIVAVALLTLGGGETDFRALFPPLVMIAVPMVLATHGAGAYSADALLTRSK